MKRYITASIPYVNAAPHIGHALEFIEVDVLARYFKSRGVDVRTQFGSDDNSLKNVRAAKAAAEDTESYVARHAEIFRSLQGALNLQFDDFIRTREDRHIRGAQKFWQAIVAKNPDDIYSKAYKGLYCVGCEAFYTEEETENGNCAVHKKPLDIVEETNYFFRLSKYQSKLERLIGSNTYRVLPETRKNEALGFIRQGLEDFSVSRSVERAEHWGVPVPRDPSQVMYVWVDALSNYINALGFADDGELYKKYWESVGSIKTHIVGKDIARFHTVYWPALLLAAGLPLPNDIYIHGFLTIEGEKMSKSIGNVVNPFDIVNEYGVDATRYILLRELPYAADGDFSDTRCEERYAELANQLGNLVSRVAAMANKYFDGNVSPKRITEIEPRLDEAMLRYDIKSYIDTVWAWVLCGNETIDKSAPFKLVKTDEAAAKTVLVEVAGYIVAIAEALIPVMPESMAKILAAYREDHIDNVEPLFPRRDTK